MAITVGGRVNRIEDREVTGATVLAIDDQGAGMVNAEIAYDEGGWAGGRSSASRSARRPTRLRSLEQPFLAR